MLNSRVDRDCVNIRDEIFNISHQILTDIIKLSMLTNTPFTFFIKKKTILNALISPTFCFSYISVRLFPFYLFPRNSSITYAVLKTMGQ